MWDFLDKLEEFEMAFAVTCIKLYLLNHKSRVVPMYFKSIVDSVQEDLSDVIRHYVRFDDYECYQLVG